MTNLIYKKGVGMLTPEIAETVNRLSIDMRDIVIRAKQLQLRNQHNREKIIEIDQNENI